MKQKINQIIYDIRRQPMISGVTFIATVMAVFLLMVVIITQRIKVVPYAPESCREQLLYGRYIHVISTDKSSEMSSSLSYAAAQKLYGGLDGIEHESYVIHGPNDIIVSGNTGNVFTARYRKVDADFFKIFDHTLVSGHYFTQDDVDARMPVAVISESTARKAFGTTDCEGKTILIDHRKFTVTGVIKDHSLLASTAAGDVFSPHNGEITALTDGNSVTGPFSVLLLLKDGIDPQYIRDQVKSRYATLNATLTPNGWEAEYHGTPFDQKTIASGDVWSNITPDTSATKRMHYMLYAILLLLPAINLSSMLHSRMRKRVSEIGVRRAYGCTRFKIFCDIITENFLLTLIGGIVGIALGITFAMTYSGLYETFDTYGTGITPSLSAVINWSTVVIAVGVCFILNLISASLPAWQASRLDPAEAINAK